MTKVPCSPDPLLALARLRCPRKLPGLGKGLLEVGAICCWGLSELLLARCRGLSWLGEGLLGGVARELALMLFTLQANHTFGGEQGLGHAVDGFECVGLHCN